MIYQHATDERDWEIADLLGGLVGKYRSDTTASDDADDDGPAHAR